MSCKGITTDKLEISMYYSITGGIGSSLQYGPGYWNAFHGKL